MTARSVCLAVQAVAALLLLVGTDLAQGQAIAYRGAGTNAVASSGNVTPGLPAGWQANDIHLLIVEQKDSVVSTVPAGWTPVTGSPINSGASNRAAIWWRRAVAGDTAPLVTHTAGSVIIARIIGFSGVDTANAFDVNNSFTASACDFTTEAAGISTVTANTMLVFVGLIGTEFTSFGTPSGSSAWTSAFLSSTQLGSEASIGAYYGLRGPTGAQAAVTATGTATQCAISFGAQIALRPANLTTTLTQTGYRLFANANSTDVGAPLAGQNTAATLSSSNAAFRLRMLLHVAGGNLAISGKSFDLQFAVRSGTCDTAFSGETYADVTASTAIAFNANATPADNAALTGNAGDPTHGADTVVNQTYKEAKTFSNNVAAINSGQDGMWDFSLKDNAAPANTTYCLRAVVDTSAVIDSYAVIAEITTSARAWTLDQTAYRLFNNTDSTAVGTALAAQNTAATLGTSYAAFRLRMLVRVTNSQLFAGTENFKLQFAPRSGSCDTAFSGETYADVTASTAIAYNNNPTPADGANLTGNAGDPTDGANTVQNQTYEESNNFSSVQDIGASEDGKWDFALQDNGAPSSTAYCFRVVLSTGVGLDTYTVIPEITTAPRGTIFYFHDAATPDTGTLPGATALSATTPNVTAATAATNRDMDQTIGTVQASVALTTLAQTALQKNWFRRFLSRPLAAQTLPTGVWRIQGGASEINIASNMLPWGAVLKVWRPSTGATVATLLDDPTLGTVEPGTTETNISSLTASINGVAVNAGDILVVELWAENTQGTATARTNTIFYDGTTETSTSSNAAYLLAPGTITFSAAGPDHYQLVAPTSSINCLPTTVTVTACTDASSPCSNAYTAANGTTANLSSSGGTLGSGTVTFNASGVATTTLSYPAAPDGTAVSVTFAGAQTAATNPPQCCPNGSSCTVTSSCSTTFNTAGFIISASAGGATTTLPTQTAGASSGTYYLRAVQTSTTTAACAAALTGANTVNWAYECNNPSTCSASNLMSVNGGTPTTVQRNNGGSVASYTSVPMTFDASGNAPFTFNFSDVGQTTLWATKTVNSATLNGSSNAFVTKPADFSLTAIKRTDNNAANPGASGASGAVFLAAGRAFSATVTALNALGSATPNFGKESPAESVGLNVSLVLPVGGLAPAIAATTGFGSFSNGVATGTDFSWPEVGIIRLVPHIKDSSYLAAGDVNGTATGNVGRFIPDSFGTAQNTPVFQTACAAGAFSYIGQPLTYSVAPVLTVTALAFGGATTQNYTGSFFRLSNASLTGRSYSAASGALDVSGLPATGADPAIVDLGAGLASLTFSSGTGIAFTKGAATAPFNAAISLAINVIDLDAVVAANPVSIGGATGMLFSNGAAQWYGRLAIKNAVGSELLALPVPLRTEYYAGATQGFVRNTADSCSSGVTLAFSGYRGNLAAGQVCVKDSGAPGVSTQGCGVAAPFADQFRASASLGDYNLILAAPGVGHNGSLTVTAIAPAWLKYAWQSGGALSNPAALPAFGLFQGHPQRIYQNEVY